MKYPYLVASLPALALDRLPPMTGEEFLFNVRGLITEEDQTELEHLLAGRFAVCRSTFGRRWAAFDGQLRREIAVVRARALGVDLRGMLADASTGGDAEVDRVLAEALAKSNPRERELQLDQSRWSKLEELKLAEPFGLAAVLAFGLQLRLAHRWNVLSDDTGAERLEAHLQHLRGTVPAMAGGQG